MIYAASRGAKCRGAFPFVLVDPGSGEGVYWGDDVPEILSLQGDYVISLHRRPEAFVELARLEN